MARISGIKIADGRVIDRPSGMCTHRRVAQNKGKAVRDCLSFDLFQLKLKRCRYCLVEYLESHVDVLPTEDQRRRPADGVVAAPEYDKALLIARHFDAVANFGVRFKSFPVRDEFHPKHHPQAANIADAFILLLQPAEAGLKVRPNLSAVVNQSFL